MASGLAHNRRVNWVSWSLLSAAFAAATAILAKKGVTAVDSNLALAIRTSVILVFTWAIALSRGSLSTISDLSQRNWVFLTLSGCATGLSWLCYFRALQLGEASRVASIDKLSVVLVILFSAMFLREHLTWNKGLGGMLIVAGALLIARE